MTIRCRKDFFGLSKPSVIVWPTHNWVQRWKHFGNWGENLLLANWNISPSGGCECDTRRCKWGSHVPLRITKVLLTEKKKFDPTPRSWFLVDFSSFWSLNTFNKPWNDTSRCCLLFMNRQFSSVKKREEWGMTLKICNFQIWPQTCARMKMQCHGNFYQLQPK